MTYAGILSYSWANVKKDDERVKAVLKWIRDNYTVDENPGIGQKTVYYYYMVFAKALQAVGEPIIVDAQGRSPQLARGSRQEAPVASARRRLLGEHGTRRDAGQQGARDVVHDVCPAGNSPGVSTRMAGCRHRHSGLRAALPVVVLLCASAHAHALTLDAHVGLGGIARAGRWTAVRVSVQSAPAETLTGELIVEWGDARVVRDLMLPAAAKKHFELYIRSADAGGTVVVRVASAGRDITRTEFPVRLAAHDEVIAVCVAGNSLASEIRAECTTSVDPSELPQSVRGYDAADEILLSEAQENAFTGGQRLALARWRVLQRLNREGVLSEAPRLPSTIPGLAAASHTDRAGVAAVAAYACLLAAVAMFFRVSTRRSLLVYPALLGAAAIGSAAALNVGRFGDGATVVVRHTSVLRQLGDDAGAAVFMRAVATYPAFDSYELRTTSADVALERPNGRHVTSEQGVDEDGRSVVRTRSGAGVRHAFLAEGTVDVHPLRLTRRGRALGLTNMSEADLLDCRLPVGTTPDRIPVLRSRATADAVLPLSPLEHIVTCTTTAAPLTFIERRRTVRTEGTTLVVSFLEPAGSD